MSNNVLPFDESVPLNKNDVGTTINNDALLNEHDIIEIKKATIEALVEYEKRKHDYKEVNNMSGYITKDTFEQFEKRIDSKLNDLPDRMADKIDAKISGLEARQTKWFVGIAISSGIGVLTVIIGVVSLIVNMFV